MIIIKLSDFICTFWQAHQPILIGQRKCVVDILDKSRNQNFIEQLMSRLQSFTRTSSETDMFISASIMSEIVMLVTILQI